MCDSHQAQEGQAGQLGLNLPSFLGRVTDKDKDIMDEYAKECADLNRVPRVGGVKEWMGCSLLCAVPAVLRRSGVELEAAAGAPYEMWLSPLFGRTDRPLAARSKFGQNEIASVL